MSLFPFRGDSAANDVVGAFGKVPGLGDFLRVRVTDGPATSLETWIEQGMAWGDGRRGAAWPQAYAAGAIHAFVYRAPRPQRCDAVVAGVIRPSRDSVGRKFPFVVFTQLPEKRVAAAPHLLPLSLGDFLEQSTDALFAAERVAGQADLEAVLQRVAPVREQDLEAHRAEYDGWTETTVATTAWSAIFGGDTRAATRALHTVFEALGPMRGQEWPTTPLSVRFPLGAAGVAAAAFWIDIVRRAALWRATAPTMFWSFDGVSGSLLVQLGDPPPSSLAELWSPDASSDHVCDLTVPTSVDPSRFLGSLAPHVVAAMDEPRTTVAQLLSALSS